MIKISHYHNTLLQIIQLPMHLHNQLVKLPYFHP